MAIVRELGLAEEMAHRFAIAHQWRIRSPRPTS
jgi:hypothetical protein